MPGIRGHIGYSPAMQNPPTQYAQGEESQFRQHVSLQLQQLSSQVENIASLKTRNSSASSYRLQFMLRRSS